MKPEAIPAPAIRVPSAAHRSKRIRLQWCTYALAFTAGPTAAVVATPSAQAQTYTVIHTFTGSPTDGANPYGNLLRDPKGNFYGTTFGGGASGAGTVFKVGNKGKESVSYNFIGGADGAGPAAGLVMDARGNLYGTTLAGGSHGFGTVFKVNSKGKEIVLYSFIGGKDGAGPAAGLVMDTKGNFYGTTFAGGAFSAGTVFKVNSKGKEIVLYSFTGGTDGSIPFAGLVLDAKGNLYGTTYEGGKSGLGTVFRVAKNGKEMVMHSFEGSDGELPGAGLMLDAKGNLYGTTSAGGGTGCGGGGCGTVFKVDDKGKASTLYRFLGGTDDGASPLSGLVRDARGNLYGTTTGGGGVVSAGTLFKVNDKGKETVLYSFTGGTDGASPQAGLVMDAKGNLYGTTSKGAASNSGTAFKITP
jgi:uncharacterized repeat protein (TIGR03803 family)